MIEQGLPLSLRPLEVRDAVVIAGWAADLEFCRAADWPSGFSFVERRRFHQRLIESPPRDLIRLGAIHGGGRLVGYVDLHGDEPHRRELGFVVGERGNWGCGLGRLAGAAGLDYGFGELALDEIWAEAADANQRSVRVLRRLGLRETGRGVESMFLDQPTYYRQFAITAEDWGRVRAH